MIVEHLYRALESECGIIVSTTDVAKYQRDFYKARKENPIFGVLKLAVSPTNPAAEVWIIRKDKADAEAT